MQKKKSRCIKGIVGNFWVISDFLLQSFPNFTISCETSKEVLQNHAWETMVYGLILSRLENTILMLFALMQMMA
jgi:hypothetical protein